MTARALAVLLYALVLLGIGVAAYSAFLGWNYYAGALVVSALIGVIVSLADREGRRRLAGIEGELAADGLNRGQV